MTLMQRPFKSVLVAEGHLHRLGDIECQLVALESLLNENEEKYSAVACLLGPIIHEFQMTTADMHFFEKKREGAKA